MTDLDTIISEAQSDSMPLSMEEFAAKKQAEREAIWGLSDQTALDVVSDGGKFQVFLDVQARFDRYSETNALLVYAQKPGATRLGDFEFWKNQGCYVKRDEKAISIIEPGKEYMREDGTVGRGYSIKKVFDISQVDARKLEQKPASQHTERQLLKSLVAHAPVPIELVDALPNNTGARYNSVPQSISVRRGMEFSKTFQSLAMTLAYADFVTGSDPPRYPIVSAHYASYALCKKYGVDTKDFAFDQEIVAFADMDVPKIKRELSQIRDTVANISGCMAKTLEPPNRRERTGHDAR